MNPKWKYVKGSPNSGCVLLVIAIGCLLLILRAILLSFPVIVIILLLTVWRETFFKLKMSTRIIIIVLLLTLNILIFYLSINMELNSNNILERPPYNPGPIRHMDDKW